MTRSLLHKRKDWPRFHGRWGDMPLLRVPPLRFHASHLHTLTAPRCCPLPEKEPQRRPPCRRDGQNTNCLRGPLLFARRQNRPIGSLPRLSLPEMTISPFSEISAEISISPRRRAPISISGPISPPAALHSVGGRRSALAASRRDAPRSCRGEAREGARRQRRPSLSSSPALLNSHASASLALLWLAIALLAAAIAPAHAERLVSGGGAHSCVLDSRHTLRCWGLNR